VPTGGNLGLSLLAAAVVAVAFNPVRNRVQQVVNRVMFGRRDDPYAVLSELGRLLAQSGEPDATLHSLVQTVAEALKLPGVAFELEQDGTWETRASVGQLGDNVETIELRHQGELVGRLVVARRSVHEGLHDDDRRLLEDVAHQAAGLAHTMRLTQALQRSREQLVLAREEERRRLRRDLHDGLGPSLASQTFRLDAVLALLSDNRPDVAQLVTSLKRQNQELVADIRRLVYELRPPALDELGLVGALAAHGGQLDRANDLRVEVTTRPDPMGDLPAAVEVAAYRIAREAVTNVARHAAASICRISLELADGALLIRVVDDGVGVRAVTQPGVGMTSMRERAEELGGSLRVSRLDGGGTEVIASLPMATLPGRAAVERAMGSAPTPPNRSIPSAVEAPHG
jgi:signal transduction histidine kinase